MAKSHQNPGPSLPEEPTAPALFEPESAAQDAEPANPPPEPQPQPEEPQRPGPKPRRKSGLVLNILLTVSILGLLAGGIGFFVSTLEYRVAEKEYDTLAESYTQLPEEAAEKETGARVVDFAALQRLNPEFVGWLEIPGTAVNYPVAQNPDNNYYINHTFEGSYNPSGSIFLDAQSTRGMGGTNSVFYGHNMKDKSMFATLQSYCQKPDFAKEHPAIYFYTEKATLVYEVFATRQTTVEDEAYRQFFANAAEQNAFLRQMDPGGALQDGDRVITLSTCVNDGDPETPHRFIVQAVLREERPPVKTLPAQ